MSFSLTQITRRRPNLESAAVAAPMVEVDDLIALAAAVGVMTTSTTRPAPGGFDSGVTTVPAAWVFA